MKAKEIAELLEKQSPVSYALNWDNVGMHIGRDNNIVKKILVTLDIDDKAVEYAVSCDVDMIVVENEVDRENLITTINSLQQIGGYANVGTKEKLLLISKITTIDEIKKNY